MSDGVVYNIEHFLPGDEIKITGIDHPKAKVKGICIETKTIVIHFIGQTINPGSRYSMLKHYYPAHTSVYHWGPTKYLDNPVIVELKKICEF